MIYWRLQGYERDSRHVSDADLNELDGSSELSRTIRRLIMHIESKILMSDSDVESVSGNDGFLVMTCSYTMQQA